MIFVGRPAVRARVRSVYIVYCVVLSRLPVDDEAHVELYPTVHDAVMASANITC